MQVPEDITGVCRQLGAGVDPEECHGDREYNEER
jgi:hypothetical protein